MSNASARDRPSARERWAAAATRARGVDGHHAAGRVQEMDGHRAAAGGEARHEIVEIACRERHDGRVEHRRGRALVFAELGVDLARDRDIGEVRGEGQAQRLLVRRVRIGVEEADRDALHALAPEVSDDFGELGELERGEHRAVGADALADLGAKPPGHEGLGLGR
jgi:hypothetical protein